MRWLRKFFYSDDPDVKIADGLTEYDAAICEELLRNSGVIAMKKNMDPLYDRYWRPVLPFANHFALWVKRSELRRARRILKAVLDRKQLIGDARTG